jgi:hypothetical protein
MFICGCSSSGSSHSTVAPEENDDLVMGNYILASKVRSGETTFDYTFQASVSNIGEKDATNVTAILTSLVTSTAVIKGDLAFGDVPAGETVASADTFVVRIDRSIDFNQDDFEWDIKANFTNSASPEIIVDDPMDVSESAVANP